VHEGEPVLGGDAGDVHDAEGVRPMAAARLMLSSIQRLFPAGSLVQCTTWAGDGSHRVPMDTYPNQVPAVDAVRITVAAP
jgi:hypothetical protein